MANIRVARRSGRVLRGGSMRRESLWIGITATSSSFAATTVAILNALNTAGLALRPFTIVRTRGIFLIATDQTVANELFGASVGLCVVSEQANAIGVTAVPTPVTDLESDLWLMHETMLGSTENLSAVGFTPRAGYTKEYDSRAMRKVEDGSQMIFVAEGIGAIGEGFTLANQGRILIKLH